MTWDVAAFREFFHTCHGVPPFDWQMTLAERVLDGDWPCVLALPTASGKTAVIDIALFALAAQSGRAPAERTAPRRIVFVVDRRVVVDSTYARACRVRDRLANAADGAPRRVAEALAAYGGEAPLHCAALRGGIWREDRWARTPLQPTVLVSTVDQVGSRLLYRGYGVSPGARPIHAGLLAHDTLLVLDEAHLSRAFEDTLRAVERFRQWAESPIPAPFRIVRMSATPGASEGVFPADPSSVLRDARLRPRLERPKLTTRKEADRRQPERTYADETGRLAEAGAKAVAVVCNRVDRARSVAHELIGRANRPRAALDADVILLTGRSRPIERDALLRRWRKRIFASDRDRDAEREARPLIVVATQCIEAGADLDFDAMVTACCPLDSLRQRLGRVNRLGARDDAEVVVVGDADVTGDFEKKPDPIYGTAAGRTWQWLNALPPRCDLSVVALAGRLPENAAELDAPANPAPLLFPAYCDLWAQTWPEPAVSPDPALFLHGARPVAPEAQVVWRADLDPARPETWRDRVAAAPPVGTEALALHLSTLRAWLGETGSLPEETDTEAGAGGESLRAGEASPEPARLFLVWRGPDETAPPVSDVATIRPGDTIVVPAAYGGCSEFGWDPGFRPDSEERAVRDFADQARWQARRPPRLRVDPSLQATWGEAAPCLLPLCALDPDAEDASARWRDGLRQAAAMRLPESEAWLSDLCAALADDPRAQMLQQGDGAGRILVSSRRWSAEAADFADETDRSSAARVPVGLRPHAERVAETAGRFAQGCCLDEGSQRAIRFAAATHDLGKADPRFQAWLCGGNRAAALRAAARLGTPLAKSDGVFRDRAAQAAARRLSGYPDGARHELVSVRLAEELLGDDADAMDRDLALHLVASHHGRCRPFAPLVEDPAPVNMSVDWDGRRLATSSDTGLHRLDGGVAERFWRLVRRYGWWGMAYMEAIVRLADHRVSEQGEGSER